MTDAAHAAREGGQADAGAAGSRRTARELNARLPAHRPLGRWAPASAHDERARRLADRAADAGAGRAHRRRACSSATTRRAAGRLRLRAGHAVDRRQPRGERPHRRRAARIASRERLQRRRRGLERRPRRRRQARHELSAHRPHERCTSTTRSRTSAPTTAARYGGSEGNLSPASRRACRTARACISRSAISTRRLVGRASRTRRASSSRRRPSGWNLGASTDIGTLRDTLTGAETERRAAGFRVGYGFDAMQLSSGVEYRFDETEQLDLTLTTRRRGCSGTTSSTRSRPTGALLGKLNHSDSESSLGAVLRRRLHRGRARLRVSPGAQRPVEHAGQVHVLLQRADARISSRCRARRPQFIQKSHVASLDLTYDLTPTLVDRRQVRAPPGRGEPGPRQPEVLRQHGRSLRRAHGLALQARTGRPRSRGACSTCRTSTTSAAARWSSSIALLERALQGRRRLQLHGLLGRPDGPELHHRGVVHQPRGEDLIRAGVPGAIRTHDLLLRRQPLYPPELRGREKRPDSG